MKENIKETIYKLENNLINNDLRVDKDFLDEILHKDYMEVGSS